MEVKVQGYSVGGKNEKDVLDLDSDSLNDEKMEHHTHQRTSQQAWFLFRVWNLSPRFLGLCVLIFLYYISYGYLQVC